MREYYFALYLSYAECLDYYHGKYKSVQVTEDGGKVVRFDARYLPAHFFFRNKRALSANINR